MFCYIYVSYVFIHKDLATRDLALRGGTQTLCFLPQRADACERGGGARSLFLMRNNFPGKIDFYNDRRSLLLIACEPRGFFAPQRHAAVEERPC